MCVFVNSTLKVNNKFPAANKFTLLFSRIYTLRKMQKKKEKQKNMDFFAIRNTNFV